MTDLTNLSDPRLERACIGYALGGCESYNELARHLRPQDFWLPDFGRLWAIMARMTDINFLTVTAEAKRHNLPINDIDLVRCITTWGWYAGQLSEEWLMAHFDGRDWHALPTPPELAVRLARQVHALATARRIGQRWQTILRRALGMT